MDKEQELFDMIPGFYKWCEDMKFELPFIEQRSRTGAKEGLYPAAYYAGQYPMLWKVPRAADSFYYQSVKK